MVRLTATGVLRVETINSHLTTINDLKQRYATNFRGSVHDRAIALRDVVLSKTPAEIQQEIAAIDALAAKRVESAGPMDELFGVAGNVNPEEEAALAEIQAHRGQDDGARVNSPA
jgi:methyl-accepting chemotaxis protein